MDPATEPNRAWRRRRERKAPDREESREVRWLSTLGEIVRDFSSPHNLDTALESALRRLVELLGARAAIIRLLDEGGQQLSVRACFPPVEKDKLPPPAPAPSTMPSRPLLVQNMAGPPIPWAPDVHPSGYALFPLTLHDRPLGFLELWWDAPYTFSSSVIQLLTLVADQMAVAVENAQLYALTQQQVLALSEVNRRLREAQQQLIQSAKLASIGQLVAGLAHELNNPVGIILGFVEVLLQDRPEDDPLTAPLRAVRQEARRCRQIVRNLLDFARSSEPQFRPTDVAGVLDMTCTLLAHQAMLHRVHIVREYQAPLPIIMADANQLQQVFTNLMLNAIQAMPQGGTLRVRARVVGEELHISFTDTGVGIPPEHLERIFEPFFTTKPAGEGTGLGLSVSKGLIEQHGGALEVVSPAPGLDAGAQFTVRLPLHWSPQENSEADSPIGREGEQVRCGKKMPLDIRS